ncbi:MAG: thiamine phosphate synthase [Xanthobacteraceae bacterium]|nr:MAG: thiamine phosphate synthase [Xanthobacteraceae bacterium]
MNPVMRRNRVDHRLYVLIDPAARGGHDLAALTDQVIAGGATLIQLRDKLGGVRDMIARARVVHAAAAGRVPVLVNDRVDVALAAGADGVHLGQDDMPVADACRVMGQRAIIGLTVKSMAQAEAASLDLLDYVCVGGVFATTSKDNPDAPVGLAGLAGIARTLRARDAAIPVGAIAGIDAGNAADVIAAGADGIAVISAVSGAADPLQAARTLRAIVDGALAQRKRP